MQCGVVVTVDDGRVVRVRGDAEHPLSRGYTCPKGRALGEFHHHPLRLDQPRMGPSGDTVPVSWDALLADLAHRMGQIIERQGPDGIAVYFGTWSWIDAFGKRAADRLWRHLGSRSRYSALSVDAIARSFVAELMGGSASLIPSLDPDSRGLTLLLGSNPVVSHGHSSGLVDPVTVMRTLAGRGGLWVADPRRTETARLANGHLAIRPGSDPAVLAFLVGAVLAEGLDDRVYLHHRVVATDLAVVARVVEPWTLERAAERTGLAPDELTRLLDALRASPGRRVTVATGTGCTMASAGNVTEWLAWALQIVTGSFEHPDGAWFNPGYLMRLDERTLPKADGSAGPGPASRPDLPGRFGELPCAALADEIEAGNVRALLVFGGNPVTALPETRRLTKAMARLEILAVADVIGSDTVALATHVLPVAGQLERTDVSFYTDLFPTVRFAHHSPPVLAPVGERRLLGEVLAELGSRLGLEPEPDPLSAMVRMAPEVREPGLYFADEPRPRGWVHERMLPDGRWRLAPPVLVEQFERWTAADPGEITEAREAPSAPPATVVIPRRSLRRMNAGLRDIARGGDDVAVWVHPVTAAEAGLDPGATTAVLHAMAGDGELTVEIKITDDIVPGALAVPHGLAGQNVSVLTATGFGGGGVDPLTGMVIQSGIPVRLTP